jgi:hypothetical protein
MRDVIESRLAASGTGGAASGANAPPGGDEPAAPSYAPSFAPPNTPTLRNPEAPPLAIEDEVSLSPEPPRMARPPMPPGANGGAPPGEGHPFQQVRRGPPPPREVPPPNFDTMWPAEPGSPMLSARPERGPMPPLRETGSALPGSEPPPGITTSPGRASVAVLKSGVVDGMGYTLYVDGSIEAELPQGTLRFASIEDLRSHLEKNN